MQRTSGKIIGSCLSYFRGYFHPRESQPHGARGLCEWSSILCISFLNLQSQSYSLPEGSQHLKGRYLLGRPAASQPPIREWRARVPPACKHLFSLPNHKYDQAFSWAPYYSQWLVMLNPQSEKIPMRHSFQSRGIFSLENVCYHICFYGENLI